MHRRRRLHRREGDTEFFVDRAYPALSMPCLINDGFEIIAGPISALGLAALTARYDEAFQDAARVKAGSTSVRANDLINFDPGFDPLFLHPPLLDAARSLVGPDIKLSAFHGRTVIPFAGEQTLHQDIQGLADGWPMVGFILPLDDFTADNGATRFLSGSQGWTEPRPTASSCDPEVVIACAPAGAMIVYNGSVWHGHGANRTPYPRRSVQGAFVRCDQPVAVDHARITRPETASRLSPLAKGLLGLEAR